MSRRHYVVTRLCAATGALAFVSHTRAATPILDWLEPAPGSTTATFPLLDDSPASAAVGGLSISQGLAFPTPVTTTLANAFWNAAPDFVDSLTGDATIRGFEIRVVPSGGAAAYAIEFSLNTGVPYVLMIGDMFSSPEGSTTGATLTSTSNAGAFAINHIGSAAWDNGVSALDQTVVWDAATGTLSPAAGANGGSMPAFFAIDAPTGTNPRLRIDVPEAYAIGSGDSILIGLAVVVPEPSAMAMLMATTGLLMRRCRHKT